MKLMTISFSMQSIFYDQMTVLGALTHSESTTKACNSWDTVGAVAWTSLCLSHTAWILIAFDCKSHIRILTVFSYIPRHSCLNQCVFLCSALIFLSSATEWHATSWERSDATYQLTAGQILQARSWICLTLKWAKASTERWPSALMKKGCQTQWQLPKSWCFFRSANQQWHDRW